MSILKKFGRANLIELSATSELWKAVQRRILCRANMRISQWILKPKFCKSPVGQLSITLTLLLSARSRFCEVGAHPGAGGHWAQNHSQEQKKLKH